MNEKLLQIVRRKPGLTCREVADVLNEYEVDARFVYDRLNRLVKLGMVTKSESTRVVTTRMVLAKNQRRNGTEPFSRVRDRIVKVVEWRAVNQETVSGEVR